MRRMSLLTPLPPALPLYLRLAYSIPVLGWIARDIAFGSKDNIVYAIVMVLSLWIIAIGTYGLPALYLPVVFLVPVMFTLLVLLTRG